MRKLTSNEHQAVILKTIDLLDSSNKRYRGAKDKCIAYFDALYSLYPDVANDLKDSDHDSRFNNQSVGRMVDYVTEVKTGHDYMLYRTKKKHYD